MTRFCLTAVVVIGVTGLAARADEADDLRNLKDVYATRPRDYPAGKGHAQPDVAVPFRWHGYREVVRRAPARSVPTSCQH